MTDFETYFQLAFFATAFALVALELVPAWQRQPEPPRRALRWTANIGLFLVGSLATAVIVPVGLYAFALHQAPGWLARPELPLFAQIALTFVVLDFWRYCEHRLFHRIPVLWRIHLVHHSDPHVDVTTGERHHPFEFLLGTLTTLALIAALGPPPVAVATYLVAATAVTLYSHANLRLPAALERVLGRAVVTPAMHAVHHSASQPQTDSNYGSVLSVWDRAFGTYVDFAAAPVQRFGLDCFSRRADGTLGRALLQPFCYRPGAAGAPGDAADDAADDAAEASARTRTRLSPAQRDAIWGALAGCAVVVAVMWPTVAALAHTWRSSEAYQYAWLVVPMVMYVLGWHAPHAGIRLDPRPDFTGVAVVIAAAACWAAASLMNVEVGRQLAFVLALQGVAMSALGWRAYRSVLPALALLFLMVPSGDLLQPTLRTLTVHALDAFATLAGLPHRVDGFVIHVGTHRYVVVDECAGLAYVTLATFLGYSFGLLLYRQGLKVIALALFGALLGVLCNVVRVDAIVLIDWLRDSQMDLTAHGTLQWIALLAALGVLFWVLERLHADAPTAAVPPDPRPRAAGRPWRRFAPVAAGLSALLAAGSGAALAAREPAAPGAPAPVFPASVGEWTLAAPARVSVDEDGATRTTALAYRRGDRELGVVVVDALAATAKLPEGALAPHDGSVWREHRRVRESACDADACIDLQHATWQRERSADARSAFYAYGLGAFTTDSRIALRAMHGWQRLGGGASRPRLVGVLADDAAPGAGDAAGLLLRMLVATR